ncbi:helix-turn-helix transcriptional regulator [Mycolicibacterium vanbaalenii]|uniref:helix-turn-helix transcriptional regulator n=1 Tax=Mycolicibacterium vanbaalenii TaxID=110539 RepID=UPI001F272296|nr:LuxR family transcriptional regulator [Mycolicibacterium vanbaalenii]
MEARAIDGFLAAAAVAPAALVIEGEPGIGKTTLWLAALSQATESGFKVLSARGAQSESVLAYAALEDLLTDVDHAVLAELPAPQRGAVETVLLRTQADGRGTDQHALSAAMVSALDNLTATSPVLLAIDDLQWLDPSSMAVITFATRRFTGPVGVLVTARNDAAGVAASARVQLSRPDAVDRLRVRPLSLGGVGALIAERLNRSFTRPGLRRIHQSSGGNPFYALELARAIDAAAPTSGAANQVPLPATLTEVVRARIGSLPSAVQDALLAVACAGTPTVALVAHAIGTDVSRAAELLEVAEVDGVINIDGQHPRFAHPLFAHGVYTGAAAGRRRAIHRRLAESVKEPELAARHLALGSVHGDAVLWESLDAAAASARRRGAPAAAAELLELSVGLGGGTMTRRIRMAGYLLHAGDVRRARTLLDEVLAEPTTGKARIQALRLLAEVRMVDDSFGEAADLLNQALAEAGDNPGLRAQLAVNLSFAQGNAGDHASALRTLDDAVADAEHLADPQLLAQALGIQTVQRFLLGQGVDEDALARAVELEDPGAAMPLALRPSTNNALLALWTGQLDRAHELMATLRRRCLAGGREVDLIYLALHHAQLELWRGNPSEATAITDDAVERASQLGGDFPLYVALTTRAALAAFAGRVDDARRDAREALAATRRFGSDAIDVWPVAILAFLEISVADLPAAEAIVAPVLARLDQTPEATEINVAPFLPDAIEALLGLGRRADAQALIERLENNGRRLDRPWMLALGARGRAALLAFDNNIDAAISAATQALREHDRLPMPFERARTLLLVGQLQRRQRRREAASSALTEALNTFEKLNTPLWAARAHAELARTKPSRNQPGDLTATEQRVAELAASGMNNRDIAAALFISLKTVEANLTRVYRKLGIRSRAQIAARLRGRF